MFTTSDILSTRFNDFIAVELIAWMIPDTLTSHKIKVVDVCVRVLAEKKTQRINTIFKPVRN